MYSNYHILRRKKWKTKLHVLIFVVTESQTHIELIIWDPLCESNISIIILMSTTIGKDLKLKSICFLGKAKLSINLDWRKQVVGRFFMPENSKIKVAILLHPVLRQGGSIKSHQEAHHVFNSSADFSWVVFTNASVVLKPIALEY